MAEKSFAASFPPAVFYYAGDPALLYVSHPMLRAYAMMLMPHDCPLDRQPGQKNFVPAIFNRNFSRRADEPASEESGTSRLFQADFELEQSR